MFDTERRLLMAKRDEIDEALRLLDEAQARAEAVLGTAAVDLPKTAAALTSTAGGKADKAKGSKAKAPKAAKSTTAKSSSEKASGSGKTSGRPRGRKPAMNLEQTTKRVLEELSQHSPLRPKDINTALEGIASRDTIRRALKGLEQTGGVRVERHNARHTDLWPVDPTANEQGADAEQAETPHLAVAS